MTSPATQAESVDGAPSTPRPAQELGRGTTIGRYVVLERLGQGGQGEVYAAFDPQLDRKVALKLVRLDKEASPERRERLLKEAQVLARLSHPHVVPVHDVGTFLGEVFIAMEFMAGGTLEKWLTTHPGWREVVARFLEAGAGLASAHAAGVIHRDFKPENVLLDASGRACVTDLGLAVEVAEAHGGRAGTKGYMAPEQLNGAQLTPAVDQFAFSVSLARALYGEAPFDPRKAPQGNPTPAWVRRVVSRGLALKPEDRFPSMDALLAALADDPARARRTRALAAVALLLALGAAVGLASWLGRETPEQRRVRECTEAARAVPVALWSSSRQGDARERFAAVQASADFARVDARVSEELERLRQFRTANCRTGDAETRTRVSSCLDGRQRTLDSLTELFSSADEQVAANGLTALSLEVLPVEACTGLPTVAPVPVSAESDAQLSSALARLSVWRAAGKTDDAIAVAVETAETAADLHARRVEAEARVALGELYADKLRLEAEGTLNEAIALAEAVGADEERARGWMALAAWYADRGKAEAARQAERQATAILERLGRPPLLEAQRLNLKGQLEEHLGDRAAARAAFEGALALRKSHLPPEHLLVLKSMTNVGLVVGGAEGKALLESALAARVRLFGPDHPEVAVAEANLGALLVQDHDCAGALPHLERSLSMRAETAEVEPMRVGRAQATLGAALRCLGREPEALAHQRTALELLQRAGASDAELRAEWRALKALLEATHAPAPELKRADDQLRALGQGL